MSNKHSSVIFYVFTLVRPNWVTRSSHLWIAKDYTN